MQESRSGFILGASAYLFWGFFPLYWPLLEPAGSIEILAHRIVWSLLFVVGLIVVTHAWSRLGVIVRDWRRMAYLSVGSVAIALNWGTFIYGVTHDHVIETSLGYFMNPLVTVLIGIIFLGERLRAAKWVALAVGFIAVIVLTLDYGRLPYIALILAFSFATYGFTKNKANLGAVEGLTMETAILTPVALGYLIWLQTQGTLAFGHEGPLNAVLLMATGIITAIPLLLFGGAATRLRLSSMGLLQYITPIMQFTLGLVVFHEVMTGPRWVGFFLVWVALVIFTMDALAGRRRTLRRSAEQVAM